MFKVERLEVKGERCLVNGAKSAYCLVFRGYSKGIRKVYDWQVGVCSFERQCKGTTKIDFLLSILDSRYFLLAISSFYIVHNT